MTKLMIEHPCAVATYSGAKIVKITWQFYPGIFVTSHTFGFTDYDWVK